MSKQYVLDIIENGIKNCDFKDAVALMKTAYRKIELMPQSLWDLFHGHEDHFIGSIAEFFDADISGYTKFKITAEAYLLINAINEAIDAYLTVRLDDEVEAFITPKKGDQQ